MIVDGVRAATPPPTRPRAGYADRTLAAGCDHSLCIRRSDGILFSWGGHQEGPEDGGWRQALSSDGSDDDDAHAGRTSWLQHLGQGLEDGPCVPVPMGMVALQQTVVVEVAAGREHSLLRDASGGVWSCGRGAACGHSDLRPSTTTRRIVALAAVHAVQVAAGEEHSLVLTAVGELYSFGANEHGQLGHSDLEPRPTPERVTALAWAPEGACLCDVSAGARHSLAVADTGALYAWGFAGALGLGGSGQFPYHASGAQPLPSRVPLPEGVRVRQASGGGQHSLAVSTDGALYSFGHGGEGQLGHGDEANRTLPERVAALDGRSRERRVAFAAAGGSHSVALTEVGAVLTFGANAYGQLGHGDQQPRLVPTAVAALADDRVVEVAAGARHVLTRLAGEPSHAAAGEPGPRPTDELRAFGSNVRGQLGIFIPLPRTWVGGASTVPERVRYPDDEEEDEGEGEGEGGSAATRAARMDFRASPGGYGVPSRSASHASLHQVPSGASGGSRGVRRAGRGAYCADAYGASRSPGPAPRLESRPGPSRSPAAGGPPQVERREVRREVRREGPRGEAVVGRRGDSEAARRSAGNSAGVADGDGRVRVREPVRPKAPRPMWETLFS